LHYPPDIFTGIVYQSAPAISIDARLNHFFIFFSLQVFLIDNFTCLQLYRALQAVTGVSAA